MVTKFICAHNHPSGNLTPSQADVQIASIVGNQGVGFYIVNNDASDLQVVVERYFQPELKLLDPADLSSKQHERNKKDAIIMTPPPLPPPHPSGRTMHSEGSMYGLYFQENWFVLGQSPSSFAGKYGGGDSDSQRQVA